ncbi:MAG: L,D-transpeptidase, partial [Myxococcales bacterium]|nr:L,D-transpeptidase [Myxococcales bacterium]
AVGAGAAEASGAAPGTGATGGDGLTIASQAGMTWVWPTPRVAERYLGYIRTGQRVRLRAPERVPGEGYPKGFFQIEPHGYVCFDRTVTPSPGGRYFEATALTAARPGPYPYRYALSNGAPMYTRVPTPKEQKQEQWEYGPAGEFVPLGRFQRGHEELATTAPIPAVDPLPGFFADGGTPNGPALGLVHQSIPLGSMFSFTRAFDVGGRTFLLSVDHTLVPADRVREFRRSSFHGVWLVPRGARPAEARLPLAWFRTRERPAYRRGADGRIEPAPGVAFAARSHAEPTGVELEQDGKRYLEVELRGSGAGRAGGAERLFAAAEDVTLVRARTSRGFAVEPGQKWILVSITDGTLVAYDDLTPVYATLQSPGQGGVPLAGMDPVKYSTTPLGSYSITFKDRATTMSPGTGLNRNFWIADVPYTQYFNAPFAMHGAFWHESFGDPMSAGCVNVAPLDAEVLFDWTDPPVPPGWQGVVGVARENGPSTRVVVTR